jgi:hypothetical protein
VKNGLHERWPCVDAAFQFLASTIKNSVSSLKQASGEEPAFI